MKKGFTLIELLVVIAIIGILTAVVMGALSDTSGKINHKYEICTQEGKYSECYYTDDYRKDDDGCVVFKYKNYKDEQKDITVCGTYNIKTN